MADTRHPASSQDRGRQNGTPANTTPTRPTCRICGAVLARDNREADGLCSPCRRRLDRERDTKKEPPQPAHDPLFIERVAELLLRNFGRRVLIGRTLRVECGPVNDAVDSLRRRWGFVVEGNKGRAGYRMVGWRQPVFKKRGRPPGKRKADDANAHG